MKLFRIPRYFVVKLQNKYIISLLITAILPLLVTLALVLSIVRGHLEEQQINALLEGMRASSSKLQSRVEALMNVKHNIDNLMVSQSRGSQAFKQHSYTSLTRFEFLRDSLVSVINLYDLEGIALYSDYVPFLQNRYESNTTVNFYPMSAYQELTEWMPDLMESGGPGRLEGKALSDQPLLTDYFRRFTLRANCVFFPHILYDANRELIAFYLFVCDADSLLECASGLPDASILITDSDGGTICSGGKSPEALAELESTQGHRLLRNGLLTTRYDISGTDWTLRLAVPVALDYDIWHSLSGVYLVILISSSLFALGVSIVITRQQTRRLQSYFNAVKDLDYTTPQAIADLPDRLDEKLSTVKNPDEVDRLMNSFSRLVRDNLRLIGAQRQHDLEIEKYKFRVLQGQINPHFLYNALETLRLCILMDRKRDALQSLDSLSRFYRVALSKGVDTISIREELDMIRSYLSIENIGYRGMIEWSMDVDEACLDMPIPKFLLQPLVENSVLHSKMASMEGNLRIDIRIKCSEGMLTMTIQDNGSGIDEETLAAIRKNLETGDVMQEEGTGFGLGNVNRRLKLFYGSECSLEIDSVPGQTTNTIVLPADILW